MGAEWNNFGHFLTFRYNKVRGLEWNTQALNIQALNGISSSWSQVVPFYSIFHLAGVSLYLGVCKYFFLEINAWHNGTLTISGNLHHLVSSNLAWSIFVWCFKKIMQQFWIFLFFGDFGGVTVQFWAFLVQICTFTPQDHQKWKTRVQTRLW